ncbi:ATP-binding protein [Paenibacillus sp. Leaf72]|uniref:ATP-binding protein n=1 Tax=Paenibacillus sp. Leaf72 TaxID=1736234 RepID=UPI0006FC6476|nr:ATP-binding protein [Paenibacillus sp. Leaf72]KQO15710.1 hypothetical protein ASF12_27185 [Paenibacillus sp. Leaf72]
MQLQETVLIAIDHARIEQMLANIVANALNASSPGDTIRIEAELDANKEQLMAAPLRSEAITAVAPFFISLFPSANRIMVNRCTNT